MLHRLVLPLVLIAALAAPLAAQPTPATVVLKQDKGTYEVVVHEVTTWGFFVEGKRGMLFRQMETVTTASDSLAQVIVAQLPGARTERVGGATRIALGHLEIAPREYDEGRRARRSFSLQGGLSAGLFETSTGAEAMLHIRPNLGERWPLAVQLGTHVGYDHVGVVASFGVQLPADAVDVEVFADLWARFATNGQNLGPATREDILGSPNAISATAQVGWPVSRLNAKVIVGGRYYFTYPFFTFESSRSGVLGSPDVSAPVDVLLQLRFEL